MTRDFLTKDYQRPQSQYTDGKPSKGEYYGVQDVDSFDESTVLLVTDMGYITLHGADLHISKLN